MLQPLTAQTMSGLRRDAAGLGMFFGLAYVDESGWLPAVRLYESDDPVPLRRLLAHAAGRLGGCEPRVAASLTYQGFASRLLSPQLACLTLGDCIPVLRPSALHWRIGHSQLLSLGAPATDWLTGPVPELIDHLVSASLSDHLEPLARAIRAEVPVAAGLLRGNVSAALISGLRLLSPHCRTPWPELAERVLAHPLLRQTGRLRDVEPIYLRHSCCLYYRTPAGGLCGDCPLGR